MAWFVFLFCAVSVQLCVFSMFDNPKDNHQSDAPVLGIAPFDLTSLGRQNQSTELVQIADLHSTKDGKTSVNISSAGNGSDVKGDDDYFSACLLVMDDNYLLPEWLAYHYTFLPLRRLIVAVDPNSKTSPERVLDRFRPYMNITVWSDEDFGFEIDDEDTPTHNHRFRQKRLIQKCLGRFKKENTSKWVSFMDTDEFVVPNWRAKKGYRITNYSRNMTVLDIMKANPHAHYNPDSACYPKNRFPVTIKESEPQQVLEDVPEGIDAHSLMTLRYRYSLGGNQSDFVKAFIDVSRVNASDIKRNNHAVHRPVLSICNEGTIKIPFQRSPFVVFHYAGTLDAFTFRQDPRGKRNATMYINKFGNTAGSYEDDSARFWISNFVEKVGSVTKANELLAGAGDVRLS
jgi:hypothetical protein